MLIENSAPIDLILGNYTIGAFDPCGGHVNPQEGYHMHATTGCSDSTRAVPDGETAMFGYALDGYAIHAPYDENVEADAGLDECNGHETEELGYHYHANQVADERRADLLQRRDHRGGNCRTGRRRATPERRRGRPTARVNIQGQDPARLDRRDSAGPGLTP